jgi:broad specificity phosphatase PhoE
MLLSDPSLRAERPSAGRPMVERHPSVLMPLRDYVRKEDPEFTLISTELLSQLLGTKLSPSVAKPLPPLRNRYFGLRHGQSEPNLNGIISSDPAVGTVEHGLTPLGRLQSRRVGTELVDLVGRESLSDIYFYSSDFTRALETAQESSNAVANILAFEQGLQSDDELPAGLREGVRYTSLLRERFFGEIDGTSLMNYNHVWPRDLVSASHTEFGVEPVEQVRERLQQKISSSFPP